MTPTIELCTEVVVPDDRAVQAVDAALEERANVDVIPLDGSRRDRPRMAMEVRKLWKPGRTLKVRFLDGDPGVQQKVVDVASQWTQHANIGLDFGPHDRADIRISFEHEGSWSTVGTDAKVYGQGEPTMNYGWLTPASTPDEISRVVLHEFGHALGCIHEHQSPDVEIPWDKPKVYDYYRRANGWDKDTVDHNIFRRYSPSGMAFSRFDASSIMLYAVPEELTVGSWSVGWNRTLSDTDKSFMASQYPREETTLNVGGPRASAQIGANGETDAFTFKAARAATHIVTTEGPTDVVMTLLGPDDPNAVVAFDDDSGLAFNARIVRKLRPGRYWVHVKHYRPAGRGPYTVGVRA